MPPYNSISVNCLVCGKLLSRPPSTIRATVFCSRKCTGKHKSGNLEDRINKNTVRIGSCLVWLGNKTKAGYGMLSVNNKTSSLSRTVWKNYKGDIPDGMDVLHSCDNPPCCEITHLFLGTPEENTQDAINKNRLSRGEDRPASKLTDDKVRQIRGYLKRGFRHIVITSFFKVDRSLISLIKRGKAWTHIV